MTTKTTQDLLTDLSDADRLEMQARIAACDRATQLLLEIEQMVQAALVRKGGSDSGQRWCSSNSCISSTCWKELTEKVRALKASKYELLKVLDVHNYYQQSVCRQIADVTADAAELDRLFQK